jgi:hypothetical protein
MVEPLGDPGNAGEPRRRRFLRSLPVGDGAAPRDLGKPCRCGHGRQAHQHYRGGSDCSLCSCSRYHRPLLARLGLGGV